MGIIMLKRFGNGVSACYVLMLFLCGIANANAASFTADQTVGCTPLSVQFTASAPGAVSWYWNLGNGNSSTLANPANIYTSPGSYTVTLIAYDALGHADTVRFTNYITVVPRPTAGFISSSN